MVLYVALVAVLNLGLGYGLAVVLGTGRSRRTRTQVGTDASLSCDHRSADSFIVSPPFAQAKELTVELTDRYTANDIPPPEDLDPVTGFNTRRSVEQQLLDLTMAHADQLPMTVALVEIDPIGGTADACEERLVHGIADTVRGMLTEAHTAGRFSDRQFLLLLPCDDLQRATNRTEQVRQRVATTQFIADGQQIRTTVTCELAQVTAEHSTEDLLEFLTESLDEARRFGGNRTFMHDGTSSTPVVPPELNYVPQTCVI